jgi:TP901 family phage tail tape measure protein
MGFFHACEEVVTQMASRIQGITVEIGGDTTKLSKALESVNKSIKGTQSGLKDVNKLLKLDPSNTELVVQKQKMLKDAIEATKEKLATLKTAAQQANEQLANGEITQQQYDALQREIVETEQNLRSLQNQAATTNATLAKIDEAGEKLQNIGSSVENVGKKFLTVTAAVTGIGTAAVKTAADFDSEMSKVSAISGATGDDFDQLRAKAREMGAKTKFSASEAASAMEYMAMAGWKTSDMLNGIEGIMNLAAASGEDLATTSDIVTDALTAFGLSAADSGHFADILAAASSNANTNVSMMGETFKYCAPIAGALGFSAKDTAEAIGLMANSGIKASQAGTSLRTIMNNLSGEVTFVGKNIGEVTIATSNADGSMRSLNDILADCRVAFSGLSESEKAANAEALVGKNAMSGFLALMNSSETDINKLRGAIENCDGASESMAETMQDNLNGQLTILKSQLEELAISFGDILMPTIRKIVSAVQQFVDKLNSMDKSTRETIIKIGLLAASIGPLLIVLGKTISTVGTAMRGFSSLAKGVRLLITHVGSASGVFSKLGVVLGGLSGPVVAVVAVIGTLVAAFMNLWNTNEEFRTAITGIWNDIVSKVKGFCDQLTQRINGLGFDFKDVTEVLKAVWDGFCQVLAPLFEGAFSYDGYQVVRKELFAHLRDPAIVIRKDSITFNTACITGLEDVVYVHVMFNSDLKRIVVRGCDENDKDALRWCIAKPDKRKSRKMTCKPFSELVYKEMGWDTECRYKMLGYRISFEGETLYVFDLLAPEIFHEGQKRKNGTDQKNAQETKSANTRKGFYPDDIVGTFGVPVEEHLKESEVQQMDGYVSVGMLTGKTIPDTGLD